MEDSVERSKVDLKIEKFKKEVLTLLPGLDTSFLKYGTISGGLDRFFEVHFFIPPENRNLSNSPYSYNGKSVVHFSNILALNSILQEKSIRLYNLHNLNDPREFTFSSKIFGLNEVLINDAKDNIFLLSLCERGILADIKNEFNLWRLYGQNGKGVILVFSIFNNPLLWRDFHISKVFYGSNKRDVFKRLIDLINEFNKTKPTISVDFGKLIAFHKSRLFELEKEVRIIYDRRKKRAGSHSRTFYKDDKQVFPIIEPDLSKLLENKDKVQYLKMPLYTTESESYELEIPVLKIEQIIIGYNYIEEVPKLLKTISDLCKIKLGYIPTNKQTRLKNYYWDLNKNQLLTRTIKGS